MAELDRTIIDDTGFIKLPVGTTAQRPNSPEIGMMRWNTDEEYVEFYNGAEWIAVEGAGSSEYEEQPRQGLNYTGTRYSVVSVEAMCYLPDQNEWHVGTGGSTIEVYDDNFNFITSYSATFPEGMAYDPFNQTIIIGDQSSTVRGYDTRGNLQFSFGAPTSISSVGFSPVLEEWFYHNRSGTVYFASMDSPTNITDSIGVSTSDSVAGFFGLDSKIYLIEYGSGVAKIWDRNGNRDNDISTSSPPGSIRGADVNWNNNRMYLGGQGGEIAEYDF